MVKASTRDAKPTASASKKTALQRRKEYAANLRVSKSVVIERPKNIPNVRKSITRKPASRVTRKSLTKCLPKFKGPLISRQEMEELGCMPIGILATGSFSRDRKQLSFSPQTTTFDKTPLRGTPVRPNSLLEKSEHEQVSDLTETLETLRASFDKDENADIPEILTSLAGLELGRTRLLLDMDLFWRLRMDCYLRLDDKRNASVACVQAFFCSTEEEEKLELYEKLHELLDLPGRSTKPRDSGARRTRSSEGFNMRVSLQSDKDSPRVKQPEPAFIITPSSRTKLDPVAESAQKRGRPSLKVTPIDVESTPMISARSGSAAKSLRFTPMIASSQRRFSLMTAARRSSFKVTPMRRSKRLAGSTKN